MNSLKILNSEIKEEENCQENMAKEEEKNKKGDEDG